MPATFSCHVAALVYVPPEEAAAAHRIVMKIKHAATASVAATINVAIHETSPPVGLQPGEGRQVPVAVPLTGVTFPEYGEYDLHVEIDDELAGDLSFSVVERQRSR